MKRKIGFYLGTHGDWGGASRALLNFVAQLDREQFEPVVIVTQEGELSESLRQQGTPCIARPARPKGTGKVEFARMLLSNLRFFRQQRFDVISVNYGSLGWTSPELLTAHWTGVPVVTHFHIIEQTTSPFLKYSKRAVVVSNYIGERTDTGQVPVEVVHNISNVEKFGHGRDIRDEFGFADGDPVVTFVGQIKKIKGIDYFLTMAERSQRDNVKFLIAGEIRDPDPAFKDQFLQRVESLPNVTYLGYRTDPENIYATSSILVMPSLWPEPCAMVLFEAAAARKPLVCAATGGTPEIIRDGETGFLFPPDSVDTMIEQVDALLADPQRGIAVGERARQIAEQEYTHRQVERLENIYKKLSPGGPSHQRRAVPA